MADTSTRRRRRRLQGGLLVTLPLFVILHLSFLAARGSALFVSYAKILELLTHLFAVPALLHSRHLREQIFVTVVVSLLYHLLDNFFPQVNVDPFRRLDLATSTALISTVFLKFLCRTDHVMGIIVLFAGVAASFEFGNMVSVGITGTVLILVLTLPCLDQVAYKTVNWVVYVLTFGGETPKATLKLDKYRWELALAFLAQALSVVFFFVGRASDALARWSHSFWHTFAFVALFLLVDIVALREDEEKDKKRARRKAHEEPQGPRRALRKDYQMLET